MQARHPRSTFLAVAGASLALLWVQGCDTGRPKADAEPAAVAAEAVDVGRFEIRSIPVKRGPGVLLRTDTATGQAWTMGAMEAPKWKPLREGVAGVPSAQGSASGRYTILAVRQNRGAPTLVRTDGATGRIWRKGATSNGPWVAVPNPEPAPSALTEPKKKAQPSSEKAQPDSDPAATEQPAVEAPEGSGSGSNTDPDPAVAAETQ